MTQVEIAKILGVQQPQVSLLLRNRAGSFSVGRLMQFLTALRQDVEITVRPTRKVHGALGAVGMILEAYFDDSSDDRRERYCAYGGLIGVRRNGTRN